MTCSMCNDEIPEKSPSEWFCSAICQQTWQEGNADRPPWATIWNGKNRQRQDEPPTGTVTPWGVVH